MNKRGTILFIIFGLLTSPRLFGQSGSVSDTSWQREQVRSAVAAEQVEFSGSNARVYQGYEYVPYFLPVSGTPFYPSEEWQNGSVEFAGTWYHDLSLMYDIYKDQPILQSADKMYRIALSKDMVQRFILANHTFVQILKNDSAGSGNMTSGFYEVLFKGKASLFVRRVKIVNVPTEPGMSRNYQESDTYYIYKRGTYYPVRTNNSVLKVLNDQKSAIKKFIRKENISYKEGREAPILAILRYYDQISK